MNISDKKLTPHGVCVLWEWEWIEDMELFEPSIENQEDSDHDTQNSTESEVPPSSVPTIPVTHTVTFKCIGTVRSPAYQNTLKKVCELRTEGHEVPINIFCEPENPIDSKAIAFRCQIKASYNWCLASGIGESDNSVTQKKPKAAGSVLEGNQARLLDLVVSFERLVVTLPPEPSLV